jgi:pyroglutamyl-peptidase
MKILITGFGPFHGAASNPSGPLARALGRLRRPAFAQVTRVAHVFATSYTAVDRELPQLLKQHRPDVVLMFGVATRTPHLRIEIRARNLRSVLFADVDGHRPAERWISRGERARAGRAPFARLLAAARTMRVPTVLSRDAGRYLCNYGYWRALELSPDGTLVQFVHVPALRRSGLTAADLLRGAAAILRALIAARRG